MAIASSCTSSCRSWSTPSCSTDTTAPPPSGCWPATPAEQLLRVAPCAGVPGAGPEHPAELGDELLPLHRSDAGGGPPVAVDALDQAVVDVGERGHLGQVRDHDHLPL